MADYVYVDGERVAPGTYAAFQVMANDFYAVFGLYLLISSGTRTHDEQRAIFFARYVTAGNVNGRYVYDTRWYEGQLWYRVSSAGTVAVPGTSLHESDRALDIRDSGSNAGVTSAGNARSNWIRSNASNYGFAANGYNFGEPWHIEYQGDPWDGQVAGGAEDMDADEKMKLDFVYKALAGANNGPTGAAVPLGWTDIDGVGKSSAYGLLDIVIENQARINNLSGFVYSGGVSASDPNYIGEEGTIYRMLKTGGSEVVIDTKELAEELAEAGVGGATTTQIEEIVNAALSKLVLVAQGKA